MPVQQHPIPQNVTQYQFRLVGDMTLKQFLQLAGGIIIGLIFYATGLPFFLKWPFIAVSVATGASMAFLPIEGRPLDQWIMAFFRSIYSPTVYTWQKSQSSLGISPSSTPSITPQATSPIPVTTPMPPNPHPITLPTPITANSVPPTPSVSAIPTSPVATAYSTPSTTLPPAEVPHRSPKPVYTAPPQPLAIEKQPRPQNIPLQTQTSSPISNIAPPTNTQTHSVPGINATFSSTLPIPHPPQTANTIVGMTLTPQGKISDSSIVEILKNGQTIRATKSNKLGQFLFAKPLDDGDYQLTAEKEGHTFPIVNLKLQNQIIPPIQLKALS